MGINVDVHLRHDFSGDDGHGVVSRVTDVGRSRVALSMVTPGGEVTFFGERVDMIDIMCGVMEALLFERKRLMPSGRAILIESEASDGPGHVIRSGFREDEEAE